jgi:GTP-binding protein EngB required for normal cell division
MKIKFDLPHGKFPRLVLAGNSNVGKSSLTKLLLSHPQWYKGKIGKTPGSTVRLMLINDPSLNYHVIDLPGFGKMVRLSHNEEMSIQKQILTYLELDAKNIFLFIEVISADRIEDELNKWYYNQEETIPLSIEFIQFVVNIHIPVIVVFNKSDKINSYKQKEILTLFTQVLADFSILVGNHDTEGGILEIFWVSTKTQKGISELKTFISDRASQLDLTAFDPRSQLKDLPSIEKQTESPAPSSDDFENNTNEDPDYQENISKKTKPNSKNNSHSKSSHSNHSRSKRSQSKRPGSAQRYRKH